MRNRRISLEIILFIFFVTFYSIAGTEYVAADQVWERGYTEPYRDATLSATVSGRLAAIKHKEGDPLKKGDIILELENKQEELEAERRKLIAESKVEVNSAGSQVETLRLDFEGTRQLFETTQSVSREELQKKELEYKLAQAELERLLIAESREDLEYRLAQEELKKRYIIAPFDGIIAKIFLEVGENCNPQEPLVRVVDNSKCRFIAHVDAMLTSGLKEGKTVTLRIENHGSPIFCEGIVEYVSPVVDPSSGLQEVKMVFDNSKGKIHPGVTGAVSLTSDDGVVINK